MSNPVAKYLDEAWESVVGGAADGLHWLKSVVVGEFADNRPISAVIADMLVSFVPGVVIVTSARDAVAVILRMAHDPKKREEVLEWILLIACLITIALPLVSAAAGAAAAGVGAVVTGIAGSELAAALRATILLLIKEATKLVEMVAFLNRFIKGDVLKFLKAVKFAEYEKALVSALKQITNKLIGIMQSVRGRLENTSMFGVKMTDHLDKIKIIIERLKHWEREFYAVQQAGLKKIPEAITELQLRIDKLLAETLPKEAHAVTPGIKAEKPTVAIPAKQEVHDAPGKPIRQQAPTDAAKPAGKKKGTGNTGTSPKNKNVSGGTPPNEKPPRKEKPEEPKKPEERPNVKVEESLEPKDFSGSKVIPKDFESVYARAPAAKIEIDTIADNLAAKYGGKTAKAPIKSRERAIEKINADYGGDANSIKDLARNTIIVPQDKLSAVTSDLERMGAKVKVINGEENPLGYSGVNSVFKTQSGISGEIQVNSPQMIFSKSSESTARSILGNDTYDQIASKAGVPGGQGHALYEQWRVLDPKSPQAQAIAEESRAYYNTVRNLSGN